MKDFSRLVQESLAHVDELFPWDLLERLDKQTMLLLDVREPHEFDTLHIANSINVPRGILEAASEYGFEETHPRLASARAEPIVAICRSGNRSVLAAHTLKILGYSEVYSLKTGLRGWNDFEQTLVDRYGARVPTPSADAYFTPKLRPAQKAPQTKDKT